MKTYAAHCFLIMFFINFLYQVFNMYYYLRISMYVFVHHVASNCRQTSDLHSLAHVANVLFGSTKLHFTHPCDTKQKTFINYMRQLYSFVAFFSQNYTKITLFKPISNLKHQKQNNDI
jgi:hypothetical protein